MSKVCRILIALSIGWTHFARACSLEEKKASGFAQTASFPGSGTAPAVDNTRPASTGVQTFSGGTSSNFDDGIFDVGREEPPSEPSRHPSTR